MRLKFVDILSVDTNTDWCPFLMKSNEKKEIENRSVTVSVVY